MPPTRASTNGQRYKLVKSYFINEK